MISRQEKVIIICIHRMKRENAPFNVIYHAYKNDFVSYMKGEELRSLHYIKDKKIKEQIKNLRDESICLVFYELE